MKKKFEEKLAKELNNSVMYSHQKAWEDSSQKNHEGNKRTIKEEDITNKLNGSLISVPAAKYAGRYWFLIYILNYQKERLSKKSR